jgi:hypothetical protein
MPKLQVEQFETVELQKYNLQCYFQVRIYSSQPRTKISDLLLGFAVYRTVYIDHFVECRCLRCGVM